MAPMSLCSLEKQFVRKTVRLKYSSSEKKQYIYRNCVIVFISPHGMASPVSIRIELTPISQDHQIDLVLLVNNLRNHLLKLTKQYSEGVDLNFECPTCEVTFIPPRKKFKQTKLNVSQENL